MMIRVSMKSMTFGIVTRSGRIVDAAPIARWSIGKPAAKVMRYYRKRGASVMLTKEP